MSVSPSDRDRLIAGAMDTFPEAVPYLAELCADFDELGSSLSDAMALLAEAGDAPGVAIDLGCGKGVFAIALAERGWRVRGVDLHSAFLTDARGRAAEAGIGGRCRFVEGDLVEVANGSGAESVDLALLVSVGRPWGDLAATVDALRRIVRPGGLILIDDAYLVGDAPAPVGYDGYASMAETERLLQSRGDSVLGCRAPTDAQAERRHERELAWLRRRGMELAARDPEAAPVVERFLAMQEGAYDDLVGPVRGAMWLLRRGR